MSKQPEALRLADLLANDPCSKAHHDAAAAELRRLHIENEAFGIHLSERMKDLAKVEARLDALLEALCELLADAEFLGWDTTKARAAIRARKEKQ